MYCFILCYQDEIVIEIGDFIYVFCFDDDFWCEGQLVLYILLYLYIVIVFSGFYYRII